MPDFEKSGILNLSLHVDFQIIKNLFRSFQLWKLFYIVQIFHFNCRVVVLVFFHVFSYIWKLFTCQNMYIIVDLFQSTNNIYIGIASLLSWCRDSLHSCRQCEQLRSNNLPVLLEYFPCHRIHLLQNNCRFSSSYTSYGR